MVLISIVITFHTTRKNKEYGLSIYSSRKVELTPSKQSLAKNLGKLLTPSNISSLIGNCLLLLISLIETQILQASKELSFYSLRSLVIQNSLTVIERPGFESRRRFMIFFSEKF